MFIKKQYFNYLLNLYIRYIYYIVTRQTWTPQARGALSLPVVINYKKNALLDFTEKKLQNELNMH